MNFPKILEFLAAVLDQDKWQCEAEKLYKKQRKLIQLWDKIKVHTDSTLCIGLLTAQCVQWQPNAYTDSPVCTLIAQYVHL